VVESSPGKFHCYWLNDGSVTLGDFDPMQQQLCELFGGDHNARDISRVLRLPGSWHQKVSKDGKRSEPFMTRIVKGGNYER
jgi:DNA primase RepB-like protein